MSKLSVSTESLDFALAHALTRGDTDIMPKASEFECIAARWADVREYLADQDLDTWKVGPLRRCLTPKRQLGFRIATQLDPYDMLLSTALIYEMGEELERHRVRRSDSIVHSYRFEPSGGGQIYSPDSSYESFRQQSLTLAQETAFVVCADIADFFPRIYFHRIESALDVATKQAGHKRALQKFLKGINQHVSYGIPVGPSAFRLLAEVVIDDVDRALLGNGYSFVRFSDDYRLFARSRREAREALAFLAQTLFRHHGLSLQESKTRLHSSSDFIAQTAPTESDMERNTLVGSFAELLSQLKDVMEAQADPDDFWSQFGFDTYGVVEYSQLALDQQAIVDSLNLWEILRRELADEGPLNIGLTKFVLRRITQLGLQDEDDLLLSNVSRMYPVFPELLQAVATQHGGPILGSRLMDLFRHADVGHLEFHRAWILSVLAAGNFGAGPNVIQAYDQHPDQFTRPAAALALGGIGETHWFRGKKSEVMSLAPWERRAVLIGSRCLPQDEAKHWLRSIQPQLNHLEGTIAEWARG